MAAVPGIPAACVQSINTAAAALRSCILGRSVGRDYESALGLSVFAPNAPNVYTTNRPEYLRLQFPNVTGWGAVLDAVYGFQNVYTRILTPQVQPPVSSMGVEGSPSPAAAPLREGAHDTEFLVSVQGLTLDAQARDGLDRAIRGAVLQELAKVDMTGSLHVSPLGQFAKAHGLNLQKDGSAAGIAVQADERKQLH